MPAPPPTVQGPRRIVLCATQRCGSTMICEDMRNTGVLGAPEEYFMPWGPARQGADWRQEWERLQPRATTPNGVFAIKVMASQLPTVEACVGGFAPGPEARSTPSLFPAFHALFRDAAWVHIVRDDVARQAISQVIARQTGVSHAVAKPEQPHFAGGVLRGNQADYNATVRFNLPAVRRRMASIVRENTIWRAFFAAYAIRPIVVRYEEIVDESPAYLARLASQVGVSIPRDTPPRRLQRLSNWVNDEWHDRLVASLVAEAASPKTQRVPESRELAPPNADS